MDRPEEETHPSFGWAEANTVQTTGAYLFDSEVKHSHYVIRALGAVMRQAAADGLIVGTGRTQPSSRRDCHARPVAVWRGVSTPSPQPVEEPLPWP